MYYSSDIDDIVILGSLFILKPMKLCVLIEVL